MSTIATPAEPRGPCGEETPAPPPPGHDFDALLKAEHDALRALFPLPPAHARRAAPAARLRNAGLATAVLALAAALLAWIDPAWRSEQHTTAIGEQRTLQLADGSRLTLDTASGVRVAWHLRSRRVELLQGQVRFDVAHSALRPFLVAAGQTQVRVVGTVFDVQRLPQGATRISVLRGRVQVHAAAQDSAAGWQLDPGDRLQVNAPGAAQPALLQHVDPHPTAEPGWAQGRLVFDRTPLRDALAEVQRYRSAPLRLHDDGRLAHQTVSGVFETTRTDQWLGLLPRVLGAKVQHQADGSVDISR